MAGVGTGGQAREGHHDSRKPWTAHCTCWSIFLSPLSPPRDTIFASIFLTIFPLCHLSCLSQEPQESLPTGPQTGPWVCFLPGPRRDLVHFAVFVLLTAQGGAFRVRLLWLGLWSSVPALTESCLLSGGRGATQCPEQVHAPHSLPLLPVPASWVMCFPRRWKRSQRNPDYRFLTFKTTD